MTKFLSDLTEDIDLVEFAKITLKKIYELNSRNIDNYRPTAIEIRDSIAAKLADIVELPIVEPPLLYISSEIEAMSPYREKFEDLKVLEFLKEHRLVQDFGIDSYWVTPSAIKSYPYLF